MSVAVFSTSALQSSVVVRSKDYKAKKANKEVKKNKASELLAFGSWIAQQLGGSGFSLEDFLAGKQILNLNSAKTIIVLRCPKFLPSSAFS